MAYWQISGVQDPVPIRQFNGVYKPDDEGFNLPDGMFTELVNFSPDKFPAITTRPGYTVVGQFGTGPVLGVGVYKDSEIHAIFSDGSWRRLNSNGTWTTLATGLYTGSDWTFCNFKGNLPQINLFGSCGNGPIKRYDGSVVQDLASGPTNGNFITTHSNRLYCADGNVLKFSALNKVSDWVSVDDAGEIALNTTDGETINGLTAGNGHITVFKPSSIHELYGKGPKSYSLDQVSADVGATGNKSVAVFDETLPFVARDGIYRYSGGIRPKKDYAAPVNNFVLSMNQTSQSKCVSGSDGKYLYFAIPYGASTQNNLILQYDPVHNTWYTSDGISVTQMVRMGSKLYMGDALGRILLIGGKTDNGTPITATAITKPYTADAISRKTEWLKMWVVASIEPGSVLNVYVSGSAKGDDWQLSKTLTGDSEIQYKEIVIPLSNLRGANAVRLKLVATGPVTVHEISRKVRVLPMRR